MLARVTSRPPAWAPPAYFRLAGIVVAGALLLQALLAVPLAVRMAAETMQLLPLGASVCAHADDGALATDRQPDGQPATHHHGQCQICQGLTASLGLLAAVVCLLAALFGLAPMRGNLATSAPRQRCRYGGYLSRAPPAAA